MKNILFSILALYSGISFADNSTIEGFIESYEKAREQKLLVEWEGENSHPNILKNLTKLQKKWQKISDCHSDKKKKKKREKNARRPKHEKIVIKEAKASSYGGMFVYPVKPEKSIRLYYSKGSFLKGAGFDVSKFNGRWYTVGPLYSDEHIKKFLKTKEHYIYLQTPSCFD